METTLATLLIVDDDKPTRMLLRGVLTRQGYNVIEAENGAEGIAAFARELPDLVLMDVMMPVLNGHEACERIRALDRDEGTPIIMLTGAEDLQAIDTAFNAGATDFITKPINWTLLTQRLRYALRNLGLAREVRRNRLRQNAARRIARIGFWEWNPADDRLSWSDDASELLGNPAAGFDTLPTLIAQVIGPDRERALQAFEALRDGVGRLELELRLHACDGERIVRMIGERGIEGSDSTRVFGALQNVTDTRKNEALVDYLALHDELTGLGNRRLFGRQVRTALEELVRAPGSKLMVIWIDLTRFHRHNDALGEAMGNKLLTQVGQRLRMLETNQGEIARVGGDEFAVMLRGGEQADLRHRAELLLSSLDFPFRLGDHETFLNCSAGAATYPEAGTDADQLINLAQQAQRNARRQGIRLAIAAPGEDRDAQAVLEVERDLRRALENNEFHLVYQPQMDLRSQRIVGVEALLRWQHPQRGLVSPADFIPVLEEMGLVSAVGNWVVLTAAHQARQWELQGLNWRMGVNLSPRQFLDADLFDNIVAAVKSAGVSPGLIEFEITESLAMQDPSHSLGLLGRLREAGFKVAIDDFGIGHSSLEYLLRFPIDTIKVDRSFVSQVTSSQADRAIIRAVTAISQSLGLSTIAEGVETLRQSDFVEALGVNEIQGYLIGKPMSAEEASKLATDFSPPSEGH